MDGRELDTLDRPSLINGFTDDVHDTTESSGTDGNLDGSTGIDNLLATNKTFSTIHSNGTDGVLSKVSSNLKNETTAMEILDLEGVENWGEVLRVELNVDNGTNDSLHLSSRCGRFCSISADFDGKIREKYGV